MSSVTCAWERAIKQLPNSLRCRIHRQEPLRYYTTLRVGGPADLFLEAGDVGSLAEIVQLAQTENLPYVVLGEGSNVCVADAGVRGLVVLNRAYEAEIASLCRVATGYNFMRLFIKTLQASLSGLEWGVGIPGTVGGALVSNAGAYRGNIGPLVQRIEVMENGERKWVGPEWMEFSYRDSRLRRPNRPPATLLQVELRLTLGDRERIRERARDFQMQRNRKQPWLPSAGSFFKNIENNHALAASLPNLPEPLKQMGRIPAAYLSELCGCKGYAVGGACVSTRHANFIVNRGGATAAQIRAVAEYVKAKVFERFGVLLEEEVLYLGDWPSNTDGVPPPQPCGK